MKATEAKLLDFLKKSPQFVIPIYQRTYSWTEKECRQLWTDILRTGADPKIKAPERGDKSHNRKSETGRSNFKLERAVGPPDERGRDLPEEHVKNGVVEKTDADREEHIPGQKFFDDRSGVHRFWRAGDRQAGKDQSDDQKGQRKVRKNESDDRPYGFGHAPAPV